MIKSLAAVLTAVLLSTAQPAQAEPSTPDLPGTSTVGLRDQLVKLLPPGSATRVDPATGKVHLRVPSTPPALARAAAEHGNRVVIEPGPPIDFISGIAGGHEIDGERLRCTASFIARDSRGARHVITAGHCTAGGGSWRSNRKLLGPAVASVIGLEGDFGVIGIVFNFTGEPKVNSYVSGTLSTQPVWGIQSLPVPSTKLLCKMGRATRYTCGSALAYDITITTRDGVTIGGLIETNLCASEGDSGGPLFTTSVVSNPPAAHAVGVASAATTSISCSDANFRTYFQPITEALDRYGLQLLTAA